MPIAYLSFAPKDTAQAKCGIQSLAKPLKSLGLTLWSRKNICPGQQWLEQMALHMNNAMVFLPLVSADYLVDSLCQQEEVAALAYQATIRTMPIILRPCGIEFSVLARRFRPFPEQGKPITTYKNGDTAWLQVQQEIMEVLSGTPPRIERS